MNEEINVTNWYSYPNRLLCSTLEEMRALVKINCEGSAERCIMSLIEECQTHANRMEAGLEDWSDLRDLNTNLRKMKKKRADLREEIEQLELKKDTDCVSPHPNKSNENKST